jgi:AraC family transcriptional regulator
MSDPTHSKITVWQSRHGPRERLAAHAHEHAYLSFVSAGSYTERVGLVDFDCAPRDVRFHPAGECHANRFGDRGAVCFNVEMPAHWFVQMEIDALPPTIAHDLSPQLLAVRCLCTRHDAEHTLAVDELLLHVVDTMRCDERVGRLADARRWIREVIAYLHDHVDSHYSLRAIATEAGVDPSYLARTFRRSMGMTLGRYVRRLRVRRAIDAIGAGRAGSLSSLAHDLGFADHAHLTRSFRAETTLTPAMFRQLVWDAESEHAMRA